MREGEIATRGKPPGNPEIKIRLASMKEVECFFIHVWKTVYKEGIMPALLDWNPLRQCDEFSVAEINGEIVGTATLAGLKTKGQPTLKTVYVVPTHRGKGAGIQLLEASIQRFKEVGKTPVFCDVTSRKMHETIERLAPELKGLLSLELSYKTYGDEWESDNL